MYDYKNNKRDSKIMKSIVLEIPDLTSIDKINQFNNLLNKTKFI